MNEREAGESALPDAALLIDWENIKFSLAQRGMTPGIAAIRDACEKFGRVVLARAYADWQQPGIREDPRDLYAAGIEPVYVPVRRYAEEQGPGTVKNSVDVRLAVDCIELIHTHPQIGLFVLASGDQDFLHVVNRLRPYGKRVVGLAVSWSASPRLAERVDHMIFYDREIDPIPEEAPLPAATPVRQASDLRLATVASSIARSEELEPAQVELALGAVMRALREYRESNREMTLSVMGIELQRILDSQVFRLVVRGRLQRIARELDRMGLLRIVRRGVDDWLYLADEEPPVPAETPAQHPEPVPRGTPRWEDLGPELQRRAIDAVRELAADPRLDWLTFNRIAERLEWPESPWTGREIGNAMTHAEVLMRDEERNWYDSFTGNVGTFWTLKLNPDHEAVRALAGVAANGED